ncbi:hypothetical protein CRYUN_Cryun26dG0006900 [Craigia yunnanensis]
MKSVTSVRLLRHFGVYPDYTQEPSSLASRRPNVKSVTLLLDKWWGSGIVHAKVWISDNRDIYIGSADNDWKSLTQVKEVGIYLVGCPKVARKKLYCRPGVTSVLLLLLFNFPLRSPRPRLPRFVEIPYVAGYPTLSDPKILRLIIDAPAYGYTSSVPQSSYLSFSPPELSCVVCHVSFSLSLFCCLLCFIQFDANCGQRLSFGRFQPDEQAWLDTIKSVGDGGTVRISTMDWLGQSPNTEQTVYWSSLSTAVSEVTSDTIITSHERWSIASFDYLLILVDYCFFPLLMMFMYGKVEIKYYKVPGYNLTGPAIHKRNRTGNIYPAYTRVNHGKYAVSDVRAHIGTSNLVWDYFYTTAGVSFGTYNPAIVSQLQEIFDADWNSPYAVPVE